MVKFRNVPCGSSSFCSEVEAVIGLAGDPTGGPTKAAGDGAPPMFESPAEVEGTISIGAETADDVGRIDEVKPCPNCGLVAGVEEDDDEEEEDEEGTPPVTVIWLMDDGGSWAAEFE